uniref:C2H2-type domain-containing protein n=1 Tax=Cacopsylla melanoneura TaxID=428564 RepID=A0A8D8VN67_9HEMI
MLALPVVQIKTEYPDDDYETLPGEQPNEFIDVYDAQHIGADRKPVLNLMYHNNNNEGDKTAPPGGFGAQQQQDHRCTKCGTQFSSLDSVLRHLLVGCVKN